MSVRVLRAQSGSWEPAADLYRTSHGWLIKVELAGVALSDVEVDLQGDEITVSGMRRDSAVMEGWRQYSMEIAYSRFERAFKLPCDLSDGKISTECRDGMLLIHVSCERGI